VEKEKLKKLRRNTILKGNRRRLKNKNENLFYANFLFIKMFIKGWALEGM